MIKGNLTDIKATLLISEGHVMRKNGFFLMKGKNFQKNISYNNQITGCSSSDIVCVNHGCAYEDRVDWGGRCLTLGKRENCQVRISL